MVYITGDIHGNPNELIQFCRAHKLIEEDVIVILGDVGFNYYLNSKDNKVKYRVAQLNPTFFCIQGNHEERPQNINTYKTKEYRGAPVWYEEEYPNIVFAKDGEVYDFDGKKCMVIGGAYSVDKYWRLYGYFINNFLDIPIDIIDSLIDIINGVNIPTENRIKLDNFINTIDVNFGWFKDEQPSDNIKRFVESQLMKYNYKIDCIFSHTCPSKYIPVEMFLSGINQDTVDNSTEEWLDIIDNKIEYNKWYCGHWHTDKKIDKMEFLFHSITNLK